MQGYAGLLPACGDHDMGALLALDEKLLADLDALDPGELDDERRLDYRLLHGAALIEAHELYEFDWRFHDPVRFLPVEAVHQLLLRPVPGFARALEARLAAIPEHLRAARGYLGRAPELIPVLWLETALGSARAGADYLRALEHHPRLHQGVARPGRLHALIEQAARALLDYAQFLEAEAGPRAQGDFACGRAHYDRLLRHRHFLEVEAPTLAAFSERLCEQTRRELSDACRQLGGGELRALLDRLGGEHPPAQALIDGYRRAMAAAEAFVVEHDLVSRPARQSLQVMETPAFLRNQIPFAAYIEPTPDDPEQRGYFYVTPPQGPEGLRAHSPPAIAHSCVHEAWPGHHLQFVTAHARPAARSLPRLLNPSATLYEGWALYCEQLMHEAGFLAGPESRLLLLRDRLWRALRILLDVGLHTGGMGLDVAAEEMVEALGFDYSQAMGDLAWYSRAPTVPMGYATGWALIGAARERLRAVAPELSPKAFHDRLLASGGIALPLVLRHEFGDEFFQSVHNMLF